AKLGEEERAELWSQLSRLVAVQPRAAAEAAWGDAARYSNLAGTEARRTFLIAFATRLCAEIEDEEDWALDWKEGSTRFNELVTEWRADIDPKTAKELEDLVLLWGKDPSREQYALRALD